MSSKPRLQAILALLLIPAVTVAGALLFNAIDPEWARGHADYERNYRLLSLVKSVSIFATLLATGVLWLLTCSFLIKSKARSQGWLLLAAFGPFGLIALTLLREDSPMPEDWYARFVAKLHIVPRVAFELCLFAAIWVVAFLGVAAKGEFMIRYQAFTTGTPVDQIVQVRNASSGMWAFSDGLEVLYLVAFLYLLWPVGCNAARRLASRQK